MQTTKRQTKSRKQIDDDEYQARHNEFIRRELERDSARRITEDYQLTKMKAQDPLKPHARVDEHNTNRI